MEVHTGKFSAEEYESIKENLLEQVANYQENDSGWRFDRVESYDINVACYKPTRGGYLFQEAKRVERYETMYKRQE